MEDTLPQQLHATLTDQSSEEKRDVGTLVVAIFEIGSDSLNLGVIDNFESLPFEPIVGHWDHVTDRYSLKRVAPHPGGSK